MHMRLNLTLSSAAWYLAFVLIAVCILLSCGSAEAVATFAGTSTKALDQGKAIYKDIPESYARGFCARQDLSGNFRDPSPAASCVPEQGLERQDLEVAQKERDGLLQISKTLTDYFDTLQQIASFGATNGSNKKQTPDNSGKNKSSSPGGTGAGAAVKSEAEASAQKAKFSPDEAGAAGELAGLLATVFISARLNHHLEENIREADPHIQKVTEALQRIVGADYERLLAQEGKALHNRYDDVVRNQTSPAIRLLVYNNWRQDIAKVDEQKAAAEAFVAALKEIREGHEKLTQSSNQITAKSLAIAIQPYISKLAALIPVIEKGF
jgi:hypothetical protein